MLTDHFRRHYPWPDNDRAVSPFLVDIDGGGRFLVDRLIARRHNPTLLEIGAFLGGSTLRWLRVSPSIDVVALDPWPDGIAADFVTQNEAWRNWPAPSDDILRTLEAEDGLYQTFLANLAPHKDRVVPVRGPSEQLLDQLAANGLKPDIIYIDADKKRSDLDDCFRLWPEAQLTGDDYLWAPERGYPMQQHVNAFAAEHGYTVRHVLHTWVLVPAYAGAGMRGISTSPPR